MGQLLIVISDLHVNSTVALSPSPEMELDDGGVYRPSRYQAWINERWDEFWNTAAEWKKQHKVTATTLINGELADNNHHATTQLITKHSGDQGKAALQVLEVVQQVSDRILVTRGSEAHVGLNASMDETLARIIGAEADDVGHHARWEYRGVIEGLRIDAAHHPGTSSRVPWTRGNAANRLAQMIIDRYTRREMLPPHLVLRGHVHMPEDSYDNHPARAIVTPSWQLNTSFGYRIGGGLLPVGGLLLLLDSGRIAGEQKLYWQWPLKDWGDL